MCDLTVFVPWYVLCCGAILQWCWKGHAIWCQQQANVFSPICEVTWWHNRDLTAASLRNHSSHVECRHGTITKDKKKRGIVKRCVVMPFLWRTNVFTESFEGVFFTYHVPTWLKIMHTYLAMLSVVSCHDILHERCVNLGVAWVLVAIWCGENAKRIGYRVSLFVNHLCSCFSYMRRLGQSLTNCCSPFKCFLNGNGSNVFRLSALECFLVPWSVKIFTFFFCSSAMCFWNPKERYPHSCFANVLNLVFQKKQQYIFPLFW